MGSTMKNKIHTIEVENNETQSVEKIIENENKIIQELLLMQVLNQVIKKLSREYLRSKY